MNARTNFRPLLSAGTLIGIGMGGFVDGILFHQILQIHNMLSARLPPNTLANVEINMVWDGIFHAFTWVMTVLGICLLWRAGSLPDVPWSARILAGSCLQGWGLFNLVEGILNHHLLGIHHVVERFGLSVADGAFLGAGVLLMVMGQVIIRTGRSNTTVTHPGPNAPRIPPGA
ncbi:MAG: DUF2243 domain-containing protein [Capsulimonadales bacterium]|nr:DUF2243 domain-containing protein [Capsulimonadales bacterium]